MELGGIKFIGINYENGQKVLWTFIAIGTVFLLKYLFNFLFKKFVRRRISRSAQFWTRQGVNLFAAFVLTLSILSIWFDDPTRLATGIGLVTAGLVFALQKVVTSLAGYLLIMRGNTFTVGERITMGGIRGDVMALNFLQTTIMEMGQPPAVQNAKPEVWVKSRQFTGRIVTVTNDKIFDQPVFNYTREFPYIWEEMTIPIKYTAPRDLAEEILRTSIEKHVQFISGLDEFELKKLDRKYGIKTGDIAPRVYLRLTDNWLELSARFLVPEHGVREIKDAISRDLLTELENAKIEIASATFEVVGFPTLQLADSSRMKNNTSIESKDNFLS